jgi:hypothetical protein
MSISLPVQRILLADSGGFCANPSCHADLFRLFESGRIATVEELAHIIPRSRDGPRDDASVPLTHRDEYQNIILLCPSCHTLVDKVADEYPADVLLDWKANHRERIRGLFRAPQVRTRAELRSLLEPLLRRNRGIFDMYGPYSELAKNPLSNAADMWHQRVVDTVIPTNRTVLDLLDRNSELLNVAELQTLEQFRLHIEGLEYNHLSGDKSSAVPLFPSGMNEIGLDA